MMAAEELISETNALRERRRVVVCALSTDCVELAFMSDDHYFSPIGHIDTADGSLFDFRGVTDNSLDKEAATVL